MPNTIHESTVQPSSPAPTDTMPLAMTQAK